ncbi:hypothetical protein [uncultured Nostoc sp.]|uniref:hypothetical protein n=1 Tax=uncultured Nostoc sp. TaxID=340711 RepID=UPI0035CBE373
MDNIVEIFDRKARRVFANKELDVSDEELNEIEQKEDLMAKAIEDEIDDIARDWELGEKFFYV